MSFEDLVYNCRKLIALHEVYDELYSMRIHNPDNCKAFDKEITWRMKRVKELCEEELQR